MPNKIDRDGWISLCNEQDMVHFAQDFAKACEHCSAVNKGVIAYLEGDLGVGKSFLSRAFIQYFLPREKVKSPTYTIVETYKHSKLSIHHFDLYRLCDPEELEYLAIRDLLDVDFVALVEWPQKGAPLFPAADILIELWHLADIRSESRQIRILGTSKKGRMIIEDMLFRG